METTDLFDMHWCSRHENMGFRKTVEYGSIIVQGKVSMALAFFSSIVSLIHYFDKLALVL